MEFGQRKPVDLAWRRKLPYDRAQRVVLVLVSVEHLSADRAQMIRERRLASPTAADGQEIHAVADERLILDQRLSRSRDRDHQLLFSGEPPHQPLKGGEKCHKQRAALLGAGGLHRTIELCTDAPAGCPSGIGLHRRPRPVRRQVDRASRFRELLGPIASIRRLFLGGAYGLRSSVFAERQHGS